MRIHSNGGLKVENANLIETNILATNGVIHAVDAVILPRSGQGPPEVPRAWGSATPRGNTLGGEEKAR